MSYYVGLMSGTSADAIDAALVDIDDNKITTIGTLAHALEPSLKQSILALYEPGDNEIDRLGLADRALGEAFAEAVTRLLQAHSVDACNVVAIGSHGQTIRHRPHKSRGAFSLQLGNAHIIAEQTGIDTIADFRGRDLACGGEGAPLAPCFHDQVFRHPNINRAVVNIGGIANLTHLPITGAVTGFDTGPGNALMDAWISRNLGRDYDQSGQWASSGKVCSALLKNMLKEPYFLRSAPKSTGRECFNLSWLKPQLQHFSELAHEDVQATLLELTAQSICNALKASHNVEELILCGGGGHNQALVKRIKALTKPTRVISSADLGIDPDQVESTLFAWLAMRCKNNLTTHLRDVTGSQANRVLGVIYPAATPR